MTNTIMTESESGSVAIETVVTVIVSVLILVSSVISIVMCCKRNKPRARSETCKELGPQDQPWYLQPQTLNHQEQQPTLFQQTQSPTVGPFQRGSYDNLSNHGNQEVQMRPTQPSEYHYQHQNSESGLLAAHRPPHEEQYVQYYVQQQQYLQEQYVKQHQTEQHQQYQQQWGHKEGQGVMHVDETGDQVTPLPSRVNQKLHAQRPPSAFRISATEEGLDDYIKMNPVSNSATLPALSNRQPPDYSKVAQEDQMSKSFNGRFGILESPP